MPEQPLVKVEKLKVIYNQGKPNEVRSLDGVDLNIFPEEYVIIFGPSGCGKSTLLYSIAGLQAATAGEVEIEGKKLSQMRKSEMVAFHQVGTGMIFQAFYLIPSLNVIDNICLPRVFRGEELKKRREEGKKLLERFGIEDQARKFPEQLSGGQKQRVSIARALINNPTIILADEPVGNLDSESAENVLKILKELNEVDKKTVILVTHNSEHLHFADRVVYMKDGKIIDEKVINEKRPQKYLAQEEEKQAENISPELRLLMRTFRNLSPQQVGSLLIPFKANQILNHILSELSEEQVETGGNFLRDFLAKQINMKFFQEKLDANMEKGGAGWNKTRAESFSRRAESIIRQAELTGKDLPVAAESLSRYLLNLFKIQLNDNLSGRLREILKMRMENKIDRLELRRKLDISEKQGGVALNKLTAERMSREIEMIMLIKYTG